MVSLREIAFDDAPSLYVLVSSDPQVTAHISPPPPSVQALHGFTSWAHRQRAEGKLLCYAVVPQGLQHAVGLFQIRKLQPGFSIAEWGFVLGSSFWGTGIFEEAAVLVADFAFETLGVHRLEARAVTTNARGNAALNKVGAKGEAVLRDALKRGTVLQPQYLWALRSIDWHERRAAMGSRFSPEALEKQIGDAIADARQRIASAAPPAASAQADAAMHPFFISNDPSIDQK